MNTYTTRRILLDARCIDHLPYGVGRYASEMCTHLPPLAPDWQWFIIRNTPQEASAPNITFINTSIPHDDFIAEQVGLMPVIQEVKPDLIHSFWFPSIEVCSCPAILTIHDTIAMSNYPEFMREPLIDKLDWYRYSCSIADHIITPSQSARQSVSSVYQYPVEKITAIHHGCSTAFRPPDTQEADAIRSKFDLPEQYIFCSAHYHNSYKNVDIVLQALNSLREQGITIPPIVSTGRIEGATRDDQWIRLPIIDDREHSTLLAGAIFMIYPSRHEGFGLPLLEAMRCGVPVISSNATSLPEVGADAAMYFNPLSVTELASCIKTMLHNSDTRHIYIQAGKHRIESFSWEKSAHDHIQVYKRTLDEFQKKPAAFRQRIIPDNPDTLRELGKMYKNAGDYNYASQLFQKMLTIARQSDAKDHLRSALYHLGECMLLKNNSAEAAKLLTECLEICPGHQSAPALLQKANTHGPEDSGS